MAEPVQLAEASVLPPLPTREEIVAFCNRGRVLEGGHRITIESVKAWDYRGWIVRHPAYRRPARYIAESVRNFLEGRLTGAGC